MLRPYFLYLKRDRAWVDTIICIWWIWSANSDLELQSLWSNCDIKCSTWFIESNLVLITFNYFNCKDTQRAISRILAAEIVRAWTLNLDCAAWNTLDNRISCPGIKCDERVTSHFMDIQGHYIRCDTVISCINWTSTASRNCVLVSIIYHFNLQSACGSVKLQLRGISLAIWCKCEVR